MKKILISFIIIIMIGVLGFFFGKNYLKKYTYTKERADLNAYLGIEDEHSYPVIYRGEKSDLEAREFDGEIYIPFETALNMFNDRPWDPIPGPWTAERALRKATRSSARMRRKSSGWPCPF